jgi:uncharacterized lipoprotein NlpE involved in copper resistance
MKKIMLALAALVLVLTGCSSPADTVSHNLSNDADHFKIERHIVFFNGITDKYLLEIYGRCSLGNNDGPHELSVTCQTGPHTYKKHFLGLSDNVSYFVEQTVPAQEGVWHYKVNFRPETLMPDFQH